jgi:hypothetical protein
MIALRIMMNRRIISLLIYSLGMWTHKTLAEADRVSRVSTINTKCAEKRKQCLASMHRKGGPLYERECFMTFNATFAIVKGEPKA